MSEGESKLENTQKHQDDFAMVVNNFKEFKDFDIDSMLQLQQDTNQMVTLKILARFSITLEESLDLIEQNLKAENFEEVGKGCHKIAGSSDLIGFKKYSQKSRKISTGVKSLDAQKDLYSEVEQYLSEGRMILNFIRTTFPEYRQYLA